MTGGADTGIAADGLTVATTSCPECGGKPMGDFRGVVFDHRRQPPECSLGKAEDATLDADYRRAASRVFGRGVASFSRPPTDTERLLLGPVGAAVSTCTVTFLSPGARARRFT